MTPGISDSRRGTRQPQQVDIASSGENTLEDLADTQGGEMVTTQVKVVR